MERVAWGLVVGAAVMVGGGCKHTAPPAAKVDFTGELPPGQVALRKIPLSQYPDFSNCLFNMGGLSTAIDNSIDWMNHPSSRASFPYLDISHDRAMASLKAFHELVDKAKGRPDAGAYVNSEIRANYEVYKSVGAPNPEGPGFTDKVMFTAYCTPIYDASLKREGPFQWPIYRRPKDLKVDPLTGEVSTPYYTRQQIEKEHKLDGLELAWFKTRWQAYVVTVQGSAILKLPDGHEMEVGYNGNNGYPYTSPGLAMLHDGLITKDQLRGDALEAYFTAHPEAQDKYLDLNQRTVFFTERPGGPFGALNVPVTRWCTIATDKTLDPLVHMTIYPRAMPAFLNVRAPVPGGDKDAYFDFQGFMMDQDTGGAIRAAGRADMYMGIGPANQFDSGRQRNEGELYYIAIKPELVEKYVNMPIGPMPTTKPSRSTPQAPRN